LLKDSPLQPCGLIFSTSGLAKTVDFKFKGLKDKRRVQANFILEVMKQGGVAVIVVMETWFASQPDMPADFTTSLAEYRGAKRPLSSKDHPCSVPKSSWFSRSAGRDQQ